MAAWKLRRETLHRIVMSRVFSDDYDVGEEFDVVSLDNNGYADANYVIV
jgi:hypothetical protein